MRSEPLMWVQPRIACTLPRESSIMSPWHHLGQWSVDRQQSQSQSAVQGRLRTPRGRLGGQHQRQPAVRGAQVADIPLRIT